MNDTIDRIDNISERSQYFEDVMNYLEYLNYEDYVSPFNNVQVAKAIGETIAQFYIKELSVRMAALAIFGLTYTYQFKPWADSLTKH